MPPREQFQFQIRHRRVKFICSSQKESLCGCRSRTSTAWPTGSAGWPCARTRRTRTSRPFWPGVSLAGSLLARRPTSPARTPPFIGLSPRPTSGRGSTTRSKSSSSLLSLIRISRLWLPGPSEWSISSLYPFSLVLSLSCESKLYLKNEIRTEISKEMYSIGHPENSYEVVVVAGVSFYWLKFNCHISDGWTIHNSSGASRRRNTFTSSSENRPWNTSTAER